MAWYNWSQTAATNASADTSINWAEGQAPSSVNDSARAMMSATAKYRDDIAGAIVTGGTSTAYTVASYSVFDTLAHMNGQMIAFTPHTANGATVTLNVDGLGAKSLRSSTGVELLASTLIAGTPYVATYNNSDAAWYLQNFYGNPYNIPLGGGIDYWGSTAPNSSFVFPTGQAISRTTYATLFTIFGTTFGVGDGSTTFNVPDKTGRASVMKEASATRLTSTYFGGNSTALGAVGGGESDTLAMANLPASPAPVSVAITSTPTSGGLQSFSPNSGSAQSNVTSGGALAIYTSATFSGISIASSHGANSSNLGSGTPIRTVQPTIVCNYILRII